MISNYDIDVAAHVDLVLYCMSYGLELRREGREYVLKNYDSLYISAACPWKWYRHSTGEGGKAIDFCVKFLGMSFQQAVFELLSFDGCSPSSPELLEHQSEHQSDERCNPRRVIAYLCQRRGIRYDIVKDLLQSGNLYQDKRGNCVFPIYDIDGNQIGGEIHGTGNTRFKGQLSSQQSSGFILSSGDVRNVCYFESAIDLISFYQIFRDKLHNYALISMGGLKASVIFARSISDCMCKSYLCVDNDSSGSSFARHLRMKHLVPSVGKDWNEYLLHLQNK